MVYLPKGLGVRFIFIIFIMNLFIDDLHRPVMTQNQLRFQALLPEIIQEQVFYYEVWALLRHSRRIFLFFFFFFTSCLVFGNQLKLLGTTYAGNWYLRWKHRGKSIASWRRIWVPESLHCLHDKRSIRLPQLLSLRRGSVPTGPGEGSRALEDWPPKLLK